MNYDCSHFKLMQHLLLCVYGHLKTMLIGCVDKTSHLLHTKKQGSALQTAQEARILREQLLGTTQFTIKAIRFLGHDDRRGQCGVEL